MARPRTKAPETQIYFISHRSGAFPVLRLRTFVRGERASQSIVNRTTALWSIWMVASLILADSGFEPPLYKLAVPKLPNPAARTDQEAGLSKFEAGWMDSTPTKRKETNINS